MRRRLCTLLMIALTLLACNLLFPEPTTIPAPTQTSIPLPPTATDSSLPLIPSPTPFPPFEPIITGSATYDVRNVLEITNQGPGTLSRLEVTIALIPDYPPYQDVITFEAMPDETLPRVVDGYGNEYAYYEFFNIGPGGSATIELRYRVEVNELHYSWTACEGEVIQGFLGSENYINTESQEIQGIVDQIAEGETDQCVTSRAFYDYVINTLRYISYNPGDVGAVGALRDGGGDCTEYADLTITLNRAGGIPARFLEGVAYSSSSDGIVTSNETKHDWLEVYLPATGWVPMDPTWGRFTMADRDTYFAGMTDDHIVVTRGRNLDVLEGGHYYLWYKWSDDLPTIVTNEETWTITKLVE